MAYSSAFGGDSSTVAYKQSLSNVLTHSTTILQWGNTILHHSPNYQNHFFIVVLHFNQVVELMWSHEVNYNYSSTSEQWYGNISTIWFSFNYWYPQDWQFSCSYLVLQNLRKNNEMLLIRVTWVVKDTRCIRCGRLLPSGPPWSQYRGSVPNRVSTICKILEILKSESISLKFWLKIFGKLVSDLL